MAELYDRLEEYKNSDYYPFHMPGHKRNGDMTGKTLADVYGLDITEIDGFDNLHQAEGILKREQEKAARLYGAEKTYFLINGSTGGILSAIGAATEKGGRLLMGRNCHKSVYHGAYLQELEVSYLYPGLLEYGMEGTITGAIEGTITGAIEGTITGAIEGTITGAIVPEEVEEKLRKEPNIGAVLITSPTYEGVVSDVGKIAAIAHRYGKPLVVDEAHGAHFGFHEGYPESGVRLGADIVIHSLHKTLPSITQTALLHVNGNLVDRRKLERYLRIFQTSSPSYVMMASISSCLDIVEKEGWKRLEKLRINRKILEEKLKACNDLMILRPELLKEELGVRWDICKLAVGSRGRKLTGQQLYDILKKKYHLQMEMAADSYVLAILTIMDTEEGLDRLADALLEIDGMLGHSEKAEMCTLEGESVTEEEIGCVQEAKDISIKEDERIQYIREGNRGNEIVLPIYQAYDKEQELIPVEKGCGRVAGEFIQVYPPGIPLVVPGERLDSRRVRQIMDYMAMGLTVQGLEKGYIWVLKVT